MLLLTATSTPLSTTDARYVYRCLDTSSKQIDKLVSILKVTDRVTKTFLSRCQALALSVHKKLSRCTTVLGTRNPEFNSLLECSATLVQSFTSKITFPSRFRSTTAPKHPREAGGLLERASDVGASILTLLHNVGEMLAARTERPTSSQEKQGPEGNVFQDFLNKAERDKGWKIQRGPEPKPAKVDPSLRGDDPFGVGCQIVNELTLPYNTLLPDDVEVGLVSFSIILLEAYRLPQTVLRVCGNVSPLHKVFGSYVVLQNVTLMGIHRDLMRVEKRGKDIVDDERFCHLMPYLKQNYPDTKDVLDKTFPSGPAKYARFHYYSPMLPNQLINSAQFRLGDWSFLTNRTNAGTEHTRS